MSIKIFDSSWSKGIYSSGRRRNTVSRVNHNGTKVPLRLGGFNTRVETRAYEIYKEAINCFVFGDGPCILLQYYVYFIWEG